MDARTGHRRAGLGDMSTYAVMSRHRAITHRYRHIYLLLQLDLPRWQGPPSLSYLITIISIARHANQLRVQKPAGLFGFEDARLESISPGVISTDTGNAGNDLVRGVKRIIELSALGRPGLDAEVAKVVSDVGGR